MPTYQYVCTACAEPLEAVQAFSDPALTECPSCSGRLRKVFSAVGVVFKGSGFYKTDSRASATKEATGPKKSASAEAGSSSGGSDTSGNGGSAAAKTTGDGSAGSGSAGAASTASSAGKASKPAKGAPARTGA